MPRNEATMSKTAARSRGRAEGAAAESANAAATLATRAQCYARLGVPEIWRWPDGPLLVLALHAGAYREVQAGIALPGFPQHELAAAMGNYPQEDPASAVAGFRRRLRENPPQR
jgi:hypothetical protein